jgi:hypothetical protein
MNPFAGANFHLIHMLKNQFILQNETPIAPKALQWNKLTRWAGEQKSTFSALFYLKYKWKFLI